MRPVGYGDQLLWTKASQDIANGIFDLKDPVPPHPGTTILIPAAGLIMLGVPMDPATQYTMIVLISLSIATIAVLCIYLRPHSAWWLGAVALLAPDARFADMTPPSALAALLMCLYVLLLIRFRERVSDLCLLSLGIVCGLLVATRIDLGAYIAVASLFFLRRHSLRSVIFVGGVSAFVFVALDPYLWVAPLAHVAGFIRQVHSNLSFDMPFDYGYSTAYFSMCVLAFALTLAILRPRLQSIPREFTLWLVAVTVALCGLLYFSEYRVMRYYYPFILTWEVLSALYLFDFLERSGLQQKWSGWLNLQCAFIAACFIAHIALLDSAIWAYRVFTQS